MRQRKARSDGGAALHIHLVPCLTAAALASAPQNQTYLNASAVRKKAPNLIKRNLMPEHSDSKVVGGTPSIRKNMLHFLRLTCVTAPVYSENQ